MPALTLMHARLEGHNVIHLLQQTGILRPRQLHVALRMAVRIVSGRTCSGSKYQGAYSPALRACTPLCPHTLHQSLVSQCRLEQQTHARAAALRLTQPFNQKQSSDWTGDDESARSHAFGRCGQREVGRGRGQKRGVSGLQMRRNLQRCCCCCCCCCTRQNCRQEASSGHGAQHQHCPMSGVSLRAQNQVLAKFMSRLLRRPPTRSPQANTAQPIKIVLQARWLRIEILPAADGDGTTQKMVNSHESRSTAEGGSATCNRDAAPLAKHSQTPTTGPSVTQC
ncbi:hypothetical protein IWX46DRAFT_580618 [Phyllosticta citricarpa]|uniref:Uncharacterized protein n=1 Tax=Phyllosticta citricarpa TaxID=55181 RepID=A0ABR1MEM6_9PEZI